MITQNILDGIIRIPTDVYGLKWFPSLERTIGNDIDWVNPSRGNWNIHWSVANDEALHRAYAACDSSPKLIVEIGVHRPEPADNNRSSTSTLLSLKSDECTYVGIDLDDRMFLNDISKRIFTVKGNSSDRTQLYKTLDWFGLGTIDFLFVDGWHSVNQCVSDWGYWERMSPTGVMAFHDTNYHPGPVALLDAVDESIFEIEIFNRDEDDAGVAYVKRRGY